MISLRLAALCGGAALAVACTRTVVVPAQTATPVPQPPPRSSAVTLGIAPEHLPRTGQCRIWVPGVSPGRQRYERSRDCGGIMRDAPAGSWVVYRPTQDRKYVHVRVVDDRRAGVIVLWRVFQADNGRLVREDRGDTAALPPAFDPPADTRPEPRRPAKPRRREPEPERPPAPDDARAVTLGIPPGHLPRTGQCRIWVPGVSPGRQRYERSRDCGGIMRDAPAGSWVVYRPTQDRKYVHVRVVDDRRAGVIVLWRVFQADNGRLVREDRGDIAALPPAFDPPADTRPEPQRPAEPRRREPAPDSPQGNRPQPEPRPEADRPQPEPRPETDRPRAEPNRPQPKPERPAAASHGIPAGHLPKVDECRVWIPGVPPGRQTGERSRSCDGIVRVAPAGSWVVSRPGKDRKHVYIRVMDQRRTGVVVTVRVFDAASGAFVREDRP